MTTVSVAVIGAGQAGLATSRLLTDSGIDHVVLERGRIAERWRARRWESLRLLTPNWMTRLPGWRYTGHDQAGFMSPRQVTAFLDGYAQDSAAPVVPAADVASLRAGAGGYRVDTTAGEWRARAVIIATGWSDRAHIPDMAATLDPRLVQETAATFSSATALPDGGVLVVGASASGVQLADEIAGSGRPVWLAVGTHTRLPRRYRGLDILWWLDAMGLLQRRVRPHLAPAHPAGQPSMQLIGRADGRNVDLRSLQDRGITLLGRLHGTDGVHAGFADDLPATTSRADARLARLLHRIDTYAHAVGLDDEILRAEPQPPVRLGTRPQALDLHRAGIDSVVWATGYRRDYPWLHVPVLDADGDIRHVGGATAAPGLHVVGMHAQTRRNSTLIDVVRHDAAAVVARVLEDLRAVPSPTGSTLGCAA